MGDLSMSHFTRKRGRWYYAANGKPVPGARSIVLGERQVLTAPELHPSRLLAVTETAARVGLSPATWRSMVSRGDAPPPVVRIGHSPAWSDGVLAAWQESRQRTRRGNTRAAAGARR